MLTTQATIGIRGTHYQLQICGRGQCRDNPSERAGRGQACTAACSRAWSASHAGGITDEYGEREYFVVLDDEAPRRLLAPPMFLAERAVGPPDRGARAAVRPEFHAPFRRFQIDPSLPLPPFVYWAPKTSTTDR